MLTSRLKVTVPEARKSGLVGNDETERLHGNFGNGETRMNRHRSHSSHSSRTVPGTMEGSPFPQFPPLLRAELGTVTPCDAETWNQETDGNDEIRPFRKDRSTGTIGGNDRKGARK